MRTSNNNIKNDIYRQQEKIIESLREQNTSLIETNQQQAQRIEYLEAVATEYQTFKSAFATGETTYSTAMQSVLNQQNAIVKTNADRINYERQAQRDLEAANREATVLKEHPELNTRLEEGKSKLEKDKQASYDIVNRWFDLSEEDFSKYRSQKQSTTRLYQSAKTRAGR